MGNIQNSYIDTFLVRNLTNNPVTLGDLVNCLVPARSTIDLLKVPRVTKEKINQSEHLKQAVNSGILRIIKPKPTGKSSQEQEMIIPDFEDIESSRTGIQSKSIYISGPTASEVIGIWYTEKPIIVSEVRGVTDLGTVTFEITVANSEVAFGGSTAITSSPIIADTNGQIQSGFTNASISQGKWILVETSAIAGGVTKLSIAIAFTAV